MGSSELKFFIDSFTLGHPVEEIQFTSACRKQTGRIKADVKNQCRIGYHQQNEEKKFRDFTC